MGPPNGRVIAVLNEVIHGPPTPQIPIPYPNIALSTKGGGKRIALSHRPISSQIRKSMGDEAGTARGLVSGKSMGRATFKKASLKTKFGWRHDLCKPELIKKAREANFKVKIIP